jgi:hypothetical protein
LHLASPADAARSRRLLRARANQMQRALAAVTLSIDGLAPRDRVIVLNQALNEAIAEYDRKSANEPRSP